MGAVPGLYPDWLQTVVTNRVKILSSLQDLTMLLLVFRPWTRCPKWRETRCRSTTVPISGEEAKLAMSSNLPK